MKKRFCYAHENYTLLERYLFVATLKDLTKFKTLLSNTDVIESCTRERVNTKRQIYKLTHLTVFAALLKEFPKGRKDTVLPNPLLKNHFVKCLTFEKTTRKPYNDNFCLVRALPLHLHGKERLDRKTSKLLNLYLKKTSGIDPANFEVFVWKRLQQWRILVRQMFS